MVRRDFLMIALMLLGGGALAVALLGHSSYPTLAEVSAVVGGAAWVVLFIFLRFAPE